MTIYWLLYAAAVWMGFTVHEAAHAFVAHALGDSTPRKQGRLSLWPHRHLSFWGSFVVPALLLAATGGHFALLWAKPVEMRPGTMRLREPYATAVVKLVGPASNAVVATLLGVGLAMLPYGASALIRDALKVGIIANITLAVLNSLPVWPLDGGAFWLLLPLRPRVREICEVTSALAMVGAVFVLPLVTPHDPFGALLGRMVDAAFSMAYSVR